MNMIQMGSTYEQQSQEFVNLLEVSNHVFTLIYVVEVVLKIIAFGHSYFSQSWNKLDFVVVIASIVDGLIKILFSRGQTFLTIARVIRVLRVSRILRLAGRHQGLQAMIQTIMFSLTPLSNVFMLLLLIFFIFSILGNFLFENIKSGNFIDDQVNFREFDKALLLLFQISTGENWPYILVDCSRTKADGCVEGETCGMSPYSYFYFDAMVLVCSYVMLNLFILFIIQQFEKYYMPKESMITRFKQDLTAFHEVWQRFTQAKYKCVKIKETRLTKFFRELGEKEPSLGFHSDAYDDATMKKSLLKMGIRSDHGFVYFNELLYRCMRRKYSQMKISRQMQIFELKTQFHIYKLTLANKNQSKRLTNNDIYNNIIRKGNGVNPFLTVMHFRTSFRTWLNHARYRIQEENPKTAGLNWRKMTRIV